ncbi:hypothetical protein GGI35DRAFT_120779 [Trichoderma velutinum]
MASMPLPVSNASYVTTPWSSVKYYTTSIGDHDVLLNETGCTPVEYDMNAPPTVGNDAVPIPDSTNFSLNIGHINNGKHNCRRIAAHLFISEFSTLISQPHDEPKRDNDGDQAGDSLLDVKAVINTAARCPGQEIRLIPAATAKYKCVTQSHGCAEVRIGWDGEIPRWRRGSELRYVVCVESFPISISSLVEDSMRAAIGMWNGIGVSFKQVARNDPATFAVVYENRNRKAYACSFFPNDLSRELIVYPSSLQQPDYLANILAHEIGHILGLRHEFAHEREKEYPSALFGSENAESIMNYYKHPEQLQVKKQDLEELERLYSYDKPEIGKIPILDVDPEVRIFSKDMAMNHVSHFFDELLTIQADMPFFCAF